MNKTVKNLILVFTLICVIVLVVFCIELFVINSGTENNTQGSTTGSENRPANTNRPNGATPASPAGSALPSGETDNGQTETPSKPIGRRYELPYSSTEKLLLYADGELFEHIEMDSGDMFVYADDEEEGNASLEICPASIPDGAEVCAETYLDGYLEGNESFVSGISQIKQSELSGVFVSGVKDGETFEAWIHDIGGGSSGNGIAFVIRYSDNEQKNALYAILDTLELIKV